MSTKTLTTPRRSGASLTDPWRATADTDLGTLARSARRIAYRPALWRHAIRFDAEHRVYTRIPVTEGVEAWLLTWLPGQRTGLHDHAGAAGAFTVVRGALTEHTAVQADNGSTTLSTSLFEPGDARPFDRDHVHEVVNTGDEPAVSIHVYAPELSDMRRYRLDGDQLIRVASEKAGRDW